MCVELARACSVCGACSCVWSLLVLVVCVELARVCGACSCVWSLLVLVVCVELARVCGGCKMFSVLGGGWGSMKLAHVSRQCNKIFLEVVIYL